jgi:hypothetical protein
MLVTAWILVCLLSVAPTLACPFLWESGEHACCPKTPTPSHQCPVQTASVCPLDLVNGKVVLSPVPAAMTEPVVVVAAVEARVPGLTGASDADEYRHRYLEFRNLRI